MLASNRNKDIPVLTLPSSLRHSGGLETSLKLTIACDKPVSYPVEMSDNVVVPAMENLAVSENKAWR